MPIMFSRFIYVLLIFVHTSFLLNKKHKNPEKIMDFTSYFDSIAYHCKGDITISVNISFAILCPQNYCNFTVFPVSYR